MSASTDETVMMDDDHYFDGDIYLRELGGSMDLIECPACATTINEREKVGNLHTCPCGNKWDITVPSNEYADSPAPNVETLSHWLLGAGGADALDGCWVEPDGACCHGYPSWPRHLGLI